ncbi:MAG: CBS domain-containing protein, partial [Sulfurimonas sp.]
MSNTLLKDILIKDVFTLKPSQKVSKMLDLMSEKKISCCIIVDDANFPLGIFTQKDTLKLIASNIDIHTTDIADVMSAPVLSAESSL